MRFATAFPRTKMETISDGGLTDGSDRTCNEHFAGKVVYGVVARAADFFLY